MKQAKDLGYSEREKKKRIFFLQSIFYDSNGIYKNSEKVVG